HGPETHRAVMWRADLRAAGHEDVAASGIGEPLLLSSDSRGARDQIGPVLVLRGRRRRLPEGLAKLRVYLLQGTRGPHARRERSRPAYVVQSASHERAIVRVGDRHWSALLRKRPRPSSTTIAARAHKTAHWRESAAHNAHTKR